MVIFITLVSLITLVNSIKLVSQDLNSILFSIPITAFNAIPVSKFNHHFKTTKHNGRVNHNN